MKFMNENHKNFYFSCLKKARKSECYEKALFYVLGLTKDCRDHIDELYDFTNGFIKNENIFSKPWITSTDLAIIRMAFHLFNGLVPTAADAPSIKDELKETQNCLPVSIFSHVDTDLFPYLFTGIELCFECIK